MCAARSRRPTPRRSNPSRCTTRASSRRWRNVENALIAYSQEQVRHHSLQEAVDASRGAVEISNELYKNGLTGYLNVVDAERSLYQAEDALVQSERTVTVNLVALYKALGGGWEDSRVADTRTR